MSTPERTLRNVAIIAHVDHGKTTLIDVLLRQSGLFRENQRVSERAMDNTDLEKERGITILAKVTSIEWQSEASPPTRINIVDTPGHADFGGEVERILNMVDGAVVLVDAAEGPMPQTKFVVGKALAMGLAPIVAVNKIDKPEERHEAVVDEVFELFDALGADDTQLDFPIVYGSAKQGWMSPSTTAGPDATTAPLLDLIVAHVPPPRTEPGEFRMLATTIEADPFLGRILTGRISSGTIRANQTVKGIARDGAVVEQGRVAKVLAFRGLERQPIEEGRAGDIVALAGLQKATVADTIAAHAVSEPIPAQPIDPPTLSMTFRVNDSPLAGTEGDKLQSRVIRERLLREAEGNVALKVTETEGGEAYEVAGRGELQLGILIETMRREGFELSLSRPRVVMIRDEDGTLMEPVEEVVIDVDDDHTGTVIQTLSERRADLVEMTPSGAGRTRVILHAPTRGLIGYQADLLSDTRGTGIMNRMFHAYVPHKGPIPVRHTGVLISNGDGEAAAYALWNLEERGPMFIDPGVKVYRGMIVGEHTRGTDLEVNVTKGKQLSNVRASGKDDAVKLTPPVRLSLERALSYISDAELVEVTPKSIRLRKVHLDPHERKKAERAREEV
jgi:GTP-binding protein